MTLTRSGNGLPRLSKVLRPITTTLPLVIFLNHLKSSGKCHGILFPWPMTRFSLIAAMALKCFTARAIGAVQHRLWNFAGWERGAIDARRRLHGPTGRPDPDPLCCAARGNGQALRHNDSILHQ